MAHEVELLPGEGHPGDPVQQRIVAINAALTNIVNSFVNGVATILQTATTVVVTHGLDYTPVPGDIMVTPLEDYNAGVRFWVHTYTATEFTIEISGAAAVDADFAWQAHKLALL